MPGPPSQAAAAAEEQGGSGREEEEKVMGKGKMRDKAETEAKGEHPPLRHTGRALGGLATSPRAPEKAFVFNLLDSCFSSVRTQGLTRRDVYSRLRLESVESLVKLWGCSLPWDPQLWPPVLQSVTAGGCPGTGRGWAYCPAHRQRIWRDHLCWGFVSPQSSGEERPVAPRALPPAATQLCCSGKGAARNIQPPTFTAPSSVSLFASFPR